MRQLLDGWADVKREDLGAITGQAVAVCGTLVAPILHRILQELGELSRLDITLVPVENTFFGSMVTVSGLLTGDEVLAVLQNGDLGDGVLLPRAMFDAKGDVTLDDRTAGDIESHLKVPVRVTSSMPEMLSHFETMR